jgi:hypothetical protein
VFKAVPALAGYFGGSEYLQGLGDRGRLRDQLEAQRLKQAEFETGRTALGPGASPEDYARHAFGYLDPKMTVTAADEYMKLLDARKPKPLGERDVAPGHIVLGADRKPIYQAPFAPKDPAERQQQMRTIYRGTTAVQQERSPDGVWKDVGSGPRFDKYDAPSITPDTLEMDAWRYLTDGTLPTNMGRGVQGSDQATKIRNKASQLAQQMGMDPSEIRLSNLTNKAAVSSIAQLARARAQILQFEKTAMANAEIALEESRKTDRTGVPIINRYLVTPIKTQLLGDPQMLKLHNATETFISEYARVMSGGYGAAQTTEGAQQRAHTLLSAANTPAQFEALIGPNGLLIREMKNREKALNDQMEEEKRRLRGGLPNRQTRPTATPSVPALPPGFQLDR